MHLRYAKRWGGAQPKDGEVKSDVNKISKQMQQREHKSLAGFISQMFTPKGFTTQTKGFTTHFGGCIDKKGNLVKEMQPTLSAEKFDKQMLTPKGFTTQRKGFTTQIGRCIFKVQGTPIKSAGSLRTCQGSNFIADVGFRFKTMARRCCTAGTRHLLNLHPQLESMNGGPGRHPRHCPKYVKTKKIDTQKVSIF